MSQIAKIINVRSQLGVTRQIFFAYLGGFDTHDAELNTHTTLLPQVSQALSAFYNATEEMGVSNNVVTFTESDFSRTFQPSGGATLGTDHAWGSHHIIMGGSVKGGVLRTGGSRRRKGFEIGGRGPNDAECSTRRCGFRRRRWINTARRWPRGSG